VSEKVHIFAWKAVSNSLGTEDNNRRRHIPVIGECRLCGYEREDSFHAVVDIWRNKCRWLSLCMRHGVDLQLELARLNIDGAYVASSGLAG
jgi:hypothetical protein